MGKITVIGIGPGSIADMTPRAHEAINKADTIAGYNTYIKLIEPLLKNKNIIGTGMMQEIDRCQMAIDEAVKGHKVAVVSSGDSGVYGMAGLVLELLLRLSVKDRPEVDIIPGISAVNAAAAVLGAPLMHDFAVISLSDLLTPWELIKKRAAFAAQGDFVIALYNPKSRKRVEHIEEIRQILLQYKDALTPVGIVRAATRNNESVTISDLGNFTKENIDMFSLVIIGNSNTYVEDNFIITPRGYKI
ncbi:precorrin-3B C(17)-methyltransferase [Pectinatus sottacetonis]|uniref:precorrin-3B C(17)-methyltransferase n=1 Tax=Pectinatus sottacetonis TaxID=1002795 RepID=UPI0018C7EE0D|nr:precorrin-3B C(17)-methyltransferase [Pectinatus sottacetonis]